MGGSARKKMNIDAGGVDDVRAGIAGAGWARTEASTRWPGYFDGAIRAGQAAKKAG
jgi:hypothetical protein